MHRSTGKRIAFWVTGVGLLVLALTVFVFRDPLLEEYRMWQVARAEDPLECPALRALYSSGSTRPVPFLLRLASKRWAEEDANLDEVLTRPADPRLNLLAAFCFQDADRAWHCLKPAIEGDDRELRRTAFAALLFALTQCRKAEERHAVHPDAAWHPLLVETRRWVEDHGSTVVVPLLVAALDDPDSRTREFALHSLAVLGPSAIPVLRKALGHPSVEIRQQSALALGRYRAEAIEAVPDLLRVLETSDPLLLETTVEALVSVDAAPQGIVDALIPRVTNPRENESVRVAAIWGLQRASYPTPKVLAALHAASEDLSEAVRKSAALALRELQRSTAATSVPHE